MTVTYYDGPIKVKAQADVEAEPHIEEPPVHPASASALAQAVAELDEQSQTLQEPELPVERERTIHAPGFTRMPVRWSPEHAPMNSMINAFAAARIREDFADLYAIIDEIKQEAQRVGADPATGEMTGRPNYAALPESSKEHWVLELAVGLFEWRQRAVQYHGEGMLAKVIRQEVFTEGYLERTGRSTVEDRTQAGQMASMQDYYFAVLCARLSEHAKAACSIAELICQRLKDFCGR